MIFSAVRRILKEDLSRSGEVPKWVDALLLPLNEVIEQVARAMQNRLTYKDNFQGVEKRVELTSGVETDVSTGSQLRIKGLRIVEAEGKIVTGWGFNRKSGNTIGITVNFSVAGKATCTVQIDLE